MNIIPQPVLALEMFRFDSLAFEASRISDSNNLQGDLNPTLSALIQNFTVVVLRIRKKLIAGDLKFGRFLKD